MGCAVVNPFWGVARDQSILVRICLKIVSDRIHHLLWYHHHPVYRGTAPSHRHSRFNWSTGNMLYSSSLLQFCSSCARALYSLRDFFCEASPYFPCPGGTVPFSSSSLLLLLYCPHCHSQHPHIRYPVAGFILLYIFFVALFLIPISLFTRDDCQLSSPYF